MIEPDFYKIVLVLLYGIEWSSGFSELHISYKQYLLTIEL